MKHVLIHYSDESDNQLFNEMSERLAAIIHQIQILAVSNLYCGGYGAPTQADPADGLEAGSVTCSRSLGLMLQGMWGSCVRPLWWRESIEEAQKSMPGTRH